MKYSQIKAVKTFAENLFSTPCYREIIENVDNEVNDFEVDNVRLILASDIDAIQAEELTNDLYCLGCFNASFISEQTGIDEDLIQIIQDSEGFEKLGEHIEKNCDMVEFAQSYSSVDGYGHHFNSYDGGEDEITINGKDYFVFDQH